MNCDRAQAVLSDRLDGERSARPRRGGRRRARGDVHAVPGVRGERAPPADVRAGAAGGAGPGPGGGDHGARRIRVVGGRPLVLPTAGRPRSSARRRLTPLIAATLAGLMAGSVVVGGPWQRPSTRPIAAAAVVMDIQRAAPSLDAFAATFAITEHGLSPDVPERRLRMDVAFLAPLRFRLDVHDETTYPSARWTPTDLTFIADGSSTYRSGATGCPADLPAGGCPPTRTTITNAIRVLGAGAGTRGPGAAADDVLVGGRHPGGGDGSRRGTRRDPGAADVRTRARAVPVPRARRHVASVLRATTAWTCGWMRRVGSRCATRSIRRPIRRVSRGSSGSACRASRATAPIFDVRLTSVERDAPDAATFDVPGWTRADTVPLASFPRRVGYLPVTPTAPGDLDAVVGRRPARRRSRRAAIGPPLHGRHGVRAHRRTARLVGHHVVRPRGTGRATGGPGGRRRRLLRAGGRRDRPPARDPRLGHERVPRIQPPSGASSWRWRPSLPLRGEALPDAWRTLTGSGISVEQVTPEDALSRSPIPVELPSALPAGYVVASAQVASDAADRRRGRRDVRVPPT